MKMLRWLSSGALRASRSTRAASSLNIFESDATVRSPSRAASLMPAELGSLAGVSAGILSTSPAPYQASHGSGIGQRTSAT